MSNKLASTSDSYTTSVVEKKTAKIVFIAILAIIGLLIALFGFTYAEPNQADPENDALFMGLILGMPGVILFLASFFFLKNKDYYSHSRFVGVYFLLVFLGTFVGDIVYFLIMRAVDSHETVFKNGRVLLVALGIAAVYSILALIPAAFYRMIVVKKNK